MLRARTRQPSRATPLSDLRQPNRGVFGDQWIALSPKAGRGSPLGPKNIKTNSFESGRSAVLALTMRHPTDLTR